jgi:hypothetical protein
MALGLGIFEISGFHREVEKKTSLFWAVKQRVLLNPSTFRDDFSVPSSRLKNPCKWDG